MNEPVLAVIDIGSNSIKLLVASSGSVAGSELRVLFQEALETRISGGIGQNKSSLTAAGLTSGIGAIVRLLEMAKPFAPTHTCIVATSAVRDAQNRADFIARVKNVTGYPLEILSGDDEALLIARGIQTDPALNGIKEFNLVDLGGGSLECIRFTGKIEQAVSLQLGAVRLTEKFVADPQKPFPDSARQAIAAETRRVLSSSGFIFLPHAQLVGTGGAFTVARAIFAHRKGITQKESWPAELSRSDLSALLDEIAPLDTPSRSRIPKLTPERADILPAALTTILVLLDDAGADRVLHSFNNLRFGVAARFFAQLRGDR